ncbi:hypothetical protein SAMN06272735_0182 [Streptomyces sp. TLI_55]|nr:hypothetical protein SAMN06272735_0182 [Streptomyces sp. TLI_55]
MSVSVLGRVAALASVDVVAVQPGLPLPEFDHLSGHPCAWGETVNLRQTGAQ